ncbi:MAG: DUF1553 domain-containing protein [Planctomycetaceae bacterium]|nr:DUF1553 domain-containing protein [Planctomycetaceae bacterium]
MTRPHHLVPPHTPWLTLLGSLVLGSCLAAADPVVDFNRDVRAILSVHCLKCHGSDVGQREAGLRLDRRDSSLSRLESNHAAIVPGQPQKSELVARIRSDDPDLRMPPAGESKPLSPAQITTLIRWIQQGAPFARHWSFVPPVRHQPPRTPTDWITLNAIDNFVQDRLRRNGLVPTPRADRESLIRRLSLDLRGLPPSLAEIDRFLADSSPGAWPQLVERFLADPAFGERWARNWLDIARYADSRGYGSDPLRPNAWRFRTWVIDAYNANKPFDRFTTEQLAGDLLPRATLEQRVATAFHRNTMTNTEGGTDDEEFRVAAVKDRVDTTLQVWMGLTMGCAKCHDHKYDPITQLEYYRFYDMFNQSADTDRGDEAPVIEAPTPQMQRDVAGLDARIASLETHRKALAPRITAENKNAPARPVTGRFVRLALTGKARYLSLAEVQVFSPTAKSTDKPVNIAIKKPTRQSSTAFDGPARLAVDGNTNGHYFEAKSTTHTAAEDNPWWEVDLGSELPVAMIHVHNRTDGGTSSRQTGLLLRLLDAKRTTVWETTLQGKPTANHQFRTSRPGPAAEEAARLADRIAALRKNRPKFPTLPVMQDLPDGKRRETFVMIRGSFLQKGQKVTSEFPTGFHPAGKHLPRTRLGVANWITDGQNPLTARVAANRFWSHLFGRGLVATEEDFGTQGEPPSHPLLLDWLATEFTRTSWDTKSLLRTIVSSHTYQQSARVTPRGLASDPTNVWLGRGPRFRLAAETIRDQALTIAGLLDRRMGGPSVYPYQPPGLWQAAFNGQRKWPTSAGSQKYRRGLYTFWRRTVPYPSMATFDAPSREICTPRRIRTNTPLQAFVTLNDPVYVEISQSLARRIVSQGGPTTAQRAAFGLRLATGRKATPRQISILAALFASELAHYKTRPQAATEVATQPRGPLPPMADPATMAAWTVVANVLLNLDQVLTKG